MDMPMVLHTRGWDSNAVEAGDTIFKFPKRDEAVERLRREAGVPASWCIRACRSGCPTWCCMRSRCCSASTA